MCHVKELRLLPMSYHQYTVALCRLYLLSCPGVDFDVQPREASKSDVFKMCESDTLSWLSGLRFHYSGFKDFILVD